MSRIDAPSKPSSAKAVRAAASTASRVSGLPGRRPGRRARRGRAAGSLSWSSSAGWPPPGPGPAARRRSRCRRPPTGCPSPPGAPTSRSPSTAYVSGRTPPTACSHPAICSSWTSRLLPTGRGGTTARGRSRGMIDRVPVEPELITDPADERAADFRDLVAGDRRPGTERGIGPVIVEGVPAVQRLLASPYRVRAVFGVPGRVAALDLPDGVPAYEADKWVV